MKQGYCKIGLGCLLAVLPAACFAEEAPALSLDQAIRQSVMAKAETGSDPFAVLGLRHRLLERCLRGEIAPALEALARHELEHQQTVEVAARYFKIQELENRLLAAGENVAATYGDWQRRQARPDSAADSSAVVASLAAEASYLKALAFREELRLALRGEYRQLAGSLGEPGAFSVDQLAENAGGLGDAGAGESLFPGLKEIALSWLGEWWRRPPAKLASWRSLCRAQLGRASEEEKAEAQRQASLAQMRVAFLQRYAIPAAESELQLAEFRLDQARGNEPGAPRLGRAMTESLLAAGALRAVQNELRLEQLRRPRKFAPSLTRQPAVDNGGH